jgi:hypothetical protein
MSNNVNKYILSLIIFLRVCTVLKAHNYGEHKYIGDMGMQQWILKNQSSTYFQNYFPLLPNKNNEYLFSPLSKYNDVTYGTLNGLSGDHSGSVYELESLLLQDCYVQKVIQIHNEYINKGYSAAPDNVLLKIDKKYVFLALKNMAHFYEYGKGWNQHFKDYNPNDIQNLIDIKTSLEAFKKLNKSNALLMYVTLHNTALFLAKQAAVKAKTNKINEAKEKLYYAYLFNAYADHFLEDAFSSGHLLVNRTFSKSIINNKSLHDFYCKQGTDVVNRKGQIWTAYGDNCYGKEGKLELPSNLHTLRYENLNTDDKRIIEAVEYSIDDIKSAFEKQLSTNDANDNAMSDIVNLDFINDIKSLDLVPLPYNSNFNYLLRVSVNDLIKKNNSKPYLRNYIRNRTANSFTIGVTNGVIGESFIQGFEFRINAGLFYSKLNSKPNNITPGSTNIFMGYTASYTNGDLSIDKTNSNVNIYKLGTRINVDLWVNKKSFVGIFMYNEIGLMRNLQKNSIVFSPQLGIQLGSLLKINYYNMPALARIPLQLILPLKFKFNATYANNYRPFYSQSVELDITF